MFTFISYTFGIECKRPVVGFLLCWLGVRKADSKLKMPVLTVSFLICITTMVLRLLSGNHFLTDVLSGAALGFAVSFAISKLCYKVYGSEVKVK
jgi:membrane-associated phospholipid phosphatase